MADPNDHPDLIGLDDIDHLAQRATDQDGEDRELDYARSSPPYLVNFKPKTNAMPTQDQQQIARELLLQIDNEGENLNQWEVGFIASLIDKDWRYFSDRQIGIIHQIADRRLP